MPEYKNMVDAVGSALATFRLQSGRSTIESLALMAKE
jgi:hypothetical protein